jgi:hypothetical protein
MIWPEEMCLIWAPIIFTIDRNRVSGFLELSGTELKAGSDAEADGPVVNSCCCPHCRGGTPWPPQVFAGFR